MLLDVEDDEGEGLVSGGDPGSADASSDMLKFFRVVAQRPKSSKALRVVGAKRQLQDDDICIVFHESRMAADGSRTVSIEPQHHGPDPTVILSALASNIDALQEHFLVWTRERKSCFYLKGYPHDDLSVDMLGQFCERRAFPDSDKYVEVSKMHESIRYLDILRHDGLVLMQRVDDADESDDSTYWQMTQKGMARLSLVHKMMNHSKFFGMRSEVAIKDMSSWELCERLQCDGWIVRKAPAKKQRLAVSPYVGGDSPKHIYMISSSFKYAKEYMRCLIQGDEWLRDGRLKALHHFQHVRYYKRILDGKADGSVLMALMADEDEKGRPALVPDMDAAALEDQPKSPESREHRTRRRRLPLPAPPVETPVETPAVNRDPDRGPANEAMI